MTRKIDYQFTAVPTQLFLCMDNNCRSTLFSLIQLSTFYETKKGATFDGWFFRTNALLEQETNLSKNVLNGALDALYQAGIIDIIPQNKGRGKTQGARKYRVNYETFLRYQSIPFEECSCSHPDFGIVTSDYKKGAPSFQLRPQLEEQPKCRKSDNNIDSIDNTEILDIIDNETIDNIDNIDNTINNNNLDYSSHFDVENNSQSRLETEKEKPLTSQNRSDTALEGLSFCSSRDIEVQNLSEDINPNPPSPSITAEFITSQIPFVYSKVSRHGEMQEPDNYTNAANDILDNRGVEVKNWVACVKSKSRMSDAALERLLETINEQTYESQAECEQTALDLMDYAAKSEIRYSRELLDRIYN